MEIEDSYDNYTKHFRVGQNFVGKKNQKFLSSEPEFFLEISKIFE